MKKNSFALRKLLCTTITIITVMTSCVQGDLYELYEEDLISKDAIFNRKKTSKDVPDYGDRTTAFNYTCFICVATCASQSETMSKYYSIFKWYVTTYKRYVTETYLNSHGYESVANMCFNSNGSSPTNGAGEQDIIALLNMYSSHSTNYDYHECSIKDSIVSFINEHKSYVDKKGRVKQYGDNAFAILCQTAEGGHVANYHSNDIDITYDCLSSQQTPTAYYGVFYPIEHK